MLAETLGSVGAMLHGGPRSCAVGVDLNCTHHRGLRSGPSPAPPPPSRRPHLRHVRDRHHRHNGKRVCTARLTCALRPAAANSRPRPGIAGAGPHSAVRARAPAYRGAARSRRPGRGREAGPAGSGGRQLGRRVRHNHRTGFQHVARCGHLQRHARVLLHQQDRRALCVDLPRCRRSARPAAAPGPATARRAAAASGRAIRARADRQHLLLAAGERAGQLPARSAAAGTASKHAVQVAPRSRACPCAGTRPSPGSRARSCGGRCRRPSGTCAMPALHQLVGGMPLMAARRSSTVAPARLAASRRSSRSVVDLARAVRPDQGHDLALAPPQATTPLSAWIAP